MTLKQRKPSREPAVVHDESRGAVLRQALMEIGCEAIGTTSDRKSLRKRVNGSHVEVKRKEFYDLRRLAILGNGLARVAHEIKNRLAIIGGFAVRIGKKPKDTARVGEFSEIICEEVRKLETLLVSLRELSRPGTASKKTESLNAIVKQIVDRLRAAIPRHIKVKLDLEPSMPKVRVVKRRMEQVITNLVRNSIEVMKEKGTIRVSTRLRKEGAVLVIEDDGPGISDEIRERIFEPFFTTKTDGNGLGLVICKQILDEQGCSIKLESVPGSGTRFIIEILIENSNPTDCSQRERKMRARESSVTRRESAKEEGDLNDTEAFYA